MHLQFSFWKKVNSSHFIFLFRFFTLWNISESQYIRIRINCFISSSFVGFFVTIYVTTFMYKSNDILRKQTALKVWPHFFYLNLNLLYLFPVELKDWRFLQGERRLSVLAGYCIVFVFHVIGVYWWYQNEDLCYPLFMVPPTAIPPFWHAIFTIIVNGMNLFRVIDFVYHCTWLFVENKPSFLAKCQKETRICKNEQFWTKSAKCQVPFLHLYFHNHW